MEKNFATYFLKSFRAERWCAKCKSNGHFFEPLSSLCLTSPRILQDRIGNAQTYILPLQKDLDLTAVVELPIGVSKYVKWDI